MVLGLPLAAVAQNVNTDELTVPIIGGGDYRVVLNNLLRIFLLWAGIIAFLFVLWGGFMYLTAGGDSAKTGAALKTITNAVIGIIIIALSYVLVLFVIQQLKKVGPTTNSVVVPGSKEDKRIQREKRQRDSGVDPAVDDGSSRQHDGRDSET